MRAHSLPHLQRATTPRGQSGFSLIEALVAMVVLSLGLLGLASLQINSLKFNQTAHLRTQAATQAYRMLDTMRASRSAVSTGDFDVALAAAKTGSSLAATEVTAWKAALSNQLPSGLGSICRTATADPTGGCTGAGNFVIITVQWNEANAVKAARAAQQFQLVSQVAP
ncbi:MAG: type IV pilus modification protein PilV [Rhodocyclaceae bacterium]|nr:type IV pilus modification protein PilV [Rhodocyclaceae bacterium]